MDFKFKIGDIVYMRHSMADAFSHADFGDGRFPRSLIILERIAQECPGGIQRHYLVADDAGGIRCNEIMLANPEEFDVIEWMKRLKAGKAARKCIMGDS